MRYLLSDQYRLRGWYKRPTGLFDTRRKEAFFLPKDAYLFLINCDGAHDIDPETLTDQEKKYLNGFLKDGIIREAPFGFFLSGEQAYKTYPARYRKQVHWSVTGACNFRCLHCFMSAPHAIHGAPSHEQIIGIADQLAECGIFQVGITGGEPLIRDDFLEIIDALNEREIGVAVIFTNGWLVDETLLDELDKRHVHPNFQLSFDGIGWHDFLRGKAGAEEQTLRTLKLLQERGHGVSVSMCVHRKNVSTIRESVKLMASYGVRSMKLGSMLALGEWARPDMRELQLTSAEEQAVFEAYIPQYFEDNAPLSIMMGGSFMYTPGDPRWKIYNEQKCSEEEEKVFPSCGVLTKNFYIGAEGMVCPCMAMAECTYAVNFPNIFETPLREILRDSPFVDLCSTTVGEVRDKSGKCRDCKFTDRCTGGCRNAALLAGDNYCGVDPGLCAFFENGYDERIRAAAQPAFEAYIKRCPPADQRSMRTETEPDCP